MIRKLKAYIAENPDGDLRLQTLAEMVHLNPSYLSQLFKQEGEAICPIISPKRASGEPASCLRRRT